MRQKKKYISKYEGKKKRILKIKMNTIKLPHFLNVYLIPVALIQSHNYSHVTIIIS